MPRTASEDAVRVPGLDDFRRELKELGPEWVKELGKLAKDSADLVAGEARTVAGRRGGVAAHIAPSIKAAAQARQAIVSLGSNAYPMALGAEFGSKRFAQFPPFRGNQWEGDGGPGYILQPTIKTKRDEFENVWLEGIDRLHSRAFPD